MRIFKLLQIKSLLNTVVACLLVPSSVSADLNKWKDEKGQVHYGDRVPSEYLRKEHSMLNEQGVVVHKSEAMKTDQELLDEEERLRIEKAVNMDKLIIARKQALRDRVLLDTFTTESDLTIARVARIEAIDSQISLAETLIKNDKKKLSMVKERIKSITKSGRAIPENVLKKELLVGRQIENNINYVNDKKIERAEILITFEHDLKRFRELKELRRNAKKLKAKN